MELTYECPGCGALDRISDVEMAPTAACPSCARVRTLDGRAFAPEGLSSCAWCVTDDLYVQKDFPHSLGLLIVVVGFATSTVFWFYYMPIATLSVLLATAALDALLYFVVPDVTICYRCLCQYRGRGSNPGGRFVPFDLAIGERYRQERLRVEQLRGLGAKD